MRHKTRKFLLTNGLDSRGYPRFIDAPIYDLLEKISVKDVDILPSKDLEPLQNCSAMVSTLNGISRDMYLPDPRAGTLFDEAFFKGNRDCGVATLVGICLTCLVFGACQVIAWNCSFPSCAEKLLWRIISISCSTLPLLLLPLSQVWDQGNVA